MIYEKVGDTIGIQNNPLTHSLYACDDSGEVISPGSPKFIISLSDKNLESLGGSLIITL